MSKLGHAPDMTAGSIAQQYHQYELLVSINGYGYITDSQQNSTYAVKAISDTLKQIGPSTFANFTRQHSGLRRKRTVLLY